MSKHFFDYDDGDYAHSISDNMAIDSDGNLLMRMGDNMAIAVYFIVLLEAIIMAHIRIGILRTGIFV